MAEDFTSEDSWFEELAQTVPEPAGGSASSCFKSRVYSRLIEAQESDGPLEPLADSAANGSPLCVFEQIMAVAPSNALQRYQYCKICHARVAGERVESAPIFWPNCPYSDFQCH